MQSRSASKHLLPALALLALAACAEEGGGSSVDATGTEAANVAEGSDEGETQTIPMTETGWLSIGRDGSVQTTFFDAGGRYRDFRNGEAWGEGRWEQRPDGSVCFEPETGSGACWETGSPEEDGSIIVTDEEGTRIEIQRVTYLAPETEGDATEEAG